MAVLESGPQIDLDGQRAAGGEVRQERKCFVSCTPDSRLKMMARSVQGLAVAGPASPVTKMQVMGGREARLLFQGQPETGADGVPILPVMSKMAMASTASQKFLVAGPRSSEPRGIHPLSDSTNNRAHLVRPCNHLDLTHEAGEVSTLIHETRWDNPVILDAQP
jgi:hypothetical protein